MALYRYILRPASPFGTPMRSDTLHGHLVCAAAELEGQEAATTLVERFVANDPPFICSSAFPKDMLPMPCLPPLPRRLFEERYTAPGGFFKGDLFAALTAYKSFRKQRHLSMRVWLDCSEDMCAEVLFNSFLFEKADFGLPTDLSRRNRPWASPYLQTHNTIDRSRGSVLLEGGFHLTESTFYRDDATLHLYVETTDVASFERLFRHIAECGFGRDRSTGKGHFTWLRDMDFDPTLLERSRRSHLMSLSVLSAENLSAMRGWYGVFSKLGKVWDGFGEKNPFKKPFLAVSEGGVFESLPSAGYVLRGLHPDPKVAQILCPLTIPLTVRSTEA